jgi:hypothetical protein
MGAVVSCLLSCMSFKAAPKTEIVLRTRWFRFVNEKEAIVFSSIAGVVFFVYVAAIILRDLMAATKITLDTIGGAFCGMWSSVSLGVRCTS